MKKYNYWEERIKSLFQAAPDANCVEDRYRNLRYLLKNKYSFLQDQDKQLVMEMLKDAVLLDRKLRLWGEGSQKTLKDKLQAEFIQTELR